MSKLTGRGFSAADAADFMKRANESHTVRWKVNAYRFTGAAGSAELLWEDIPIVGGQLTLDSSDPVRRKLNLEVGGGEDFAPRVYTDPLAPFGQYLVVWMTIDRSDGSFFGWLKMGEFHLISNVFEWPSQICTVEAGDWSARVEEYLLLHNQNFKGRRVKNAIVDLCDDAVPGKAFGVTVQASATADAKHVMGKYIASAGTGRWSVCTEIADNEGLETYFDAAGNLVLRDQITPAEDDVVMQKGPDIGTVKSPVATIAEGSNLIGVTASVTREGAANAVRINASGTVTRRDKHQITKGKGSKGIETHEKNWHDAVQVVVSDGPARWGDAFGHLPIVREKQFKSVGPSRGEEMASLRRRAVNILQRRRGLIRYLDADMVGGWWLEPDDKVKMKFGGVTEDHFIQSVQFDLSGQSATRIRTRQLAVTDPLAGG